VALSAVRPTAPRPVDRDPPPLPVGEEAAELARQLLVKPLGWTPRGRSSVGRASASQAEGRGFEPHRPLKDSCGVASLSPCLSLDSMTRKWPDRDGVCGDCGLARSAAGAWQQSSSRRSQEGTKGCAAPSSITKRSWSSRIDRKRGRRRSAASHTALDDRGGSGHGAAHDAVPRALAADEREARPLEEGARPVVEHGLLLALRVVRVALDDATARLRDQVEGPLQRDGRQPLSPVAPVHEDAGDPVVGDEVEPSSYCLRW
jgi:hypothetical protein